MSLTPETLRAALSEAARAGRPVTYLMLADSLMLGELHRIHRLTEMLEDLVRQDHAAGRPLLAALASGKAGVPGRGFFLLLQELGLYDGQPQGPEAAARYQEELARAIAHWGR